MNGPHNPRPWDILDLAEGYNSTDGTMPPPDAAVIPLRHAPSVRGRVPATRQALDRLVKDSDRWTRAVIRELARLGYDLADDTPLMEGETYSQIRLTGVGAGSMILTLALAPAGETVEVSSVTFGDTTWTAREAARWLKAREAR